MNYTDKFGYLPAGHRIEWSDGFIEPLAHFSDAKQWIEKQAHPDGYIYPPLVHTRRMHLDGKFSKIPQTDRPALLHQLPATHELLLARPHSEDLRSGLAGYIMHFAGFLYGYRCQFVDWWVDGRIPLRSQADRGVRQSDANLCVARAFVKWHTWNSHERVLAANALFLHCRAPSYEWPWERFQAEYQVLDALWAIVKPTILQKSVTHSERIEVLCKEFGLAYDSDLVRRIVRARNELIHEALWGGANPLESQGEFRIPLILHRLAGRLLLAIVGVRGSYIATPWWGMGQAFFKAE